MAAKFEITPKLYHKKVFMMEYLSMCKLPGYPPPRFRTCQIVLTQPNEIQERKKVMSKMVLAIPQFQKHHQTWYVTVMRHGTGVKNRGAAALKLAARLWTAPASLLCGRPPHTSAVPSSFRGVRHQ